MDRRPGEADLLNTITTAIESFLVRRMVCRLNTRGYNRLFLDLAGLELGSDHIAAQIVTRLKAGTAENDRWPDDAPFLKAWRETPLYSALTRSRMRMILEALEESLRSDKSEDQSCPRNLTIEHILPQEWRAHWPVENGANRIEREMARDGLVHTIGNLTLLTSPMNGSQSNRPWTPNEIYSEGKCALLAKHTTLHLNKSIADHSIWDEGAIDRRAASLFTMAVAIWPAPEAF